jgi:hypothetical protein
MPGKVLQWSLLAAGASLALMLISVLLATAPDGHWAQNQSRERVLREQVLAVKRNLDKGIQERQLALLTLAKAPIERSDLEELRSNDPAYAWIGVTDIKGKVVIDTGGLLSGVDVSTRPWFRGARGGPFTADVHDAVLLANRLSAGRSEPLRFIDIAVPVTQAGEFTGVLGAHLYSNWLDEVSQATSAEFDQFQGEVLLLSQDGTVQAGPGHMKGQRVIVDPGLRKVRWPEDGAYQWYSEVGGSLASGARWTVLARAPPSAGALDFLLRGWRKTSTASVAEPNRPGSAP